MSNKQSFRRFQIGPGASSLIMLLVVLSMGALSILALVSAQGDYSLSVRSADVAEQVYQLNEMAENRLAEIDAALFAAAKTAADDTAYLVAVAQTIPYGTTLKERTISWTERLDSGRCLDCAIAVSELNSPSRFHWTTHTLYYDTEEMDFGDTWN